MAKIKAEVLEEGEEVYLKFDLEKNNLLCLTKDSPIDVKKVFNELIIKSKKELVEIEFHGDGKDLFSNICREYVNQLNGELKTIREELERNQLIN